MCTCYTHLPTTSCKKTQRVQMKKIKLCAASEARYEFKPAWQIAQNPITVMELTIIAVSKQFHNVLFGGEGLLCKLCLHLLFPQQIFLYLDIPQGSNKVPISPSAACRPPPAKCCPPSVRPLAARRPHGPPATAYIFHMWVYICVYTYTYTHIISKSIYIYIHICMFDIIYVCIHIIMHIY